MLVKKKNISLLWELNSTFMFILLHEKFLQFDWLRAVVFQLKGAMSPHTHARANENKLEKDGPTFSSSVGDFGRLFLSV